MLKVFSKIFGSHSDRELRDIEPLIVKIEALADEYGALTDAELKAKTPWFRERLARGETLDDLLPEAFAAAREAAYRELRMRPYRVQLIGGVVLHQGRIAEMKTGEGKTLVAVMPAYLNALAGKGVHIVTVNDYLAKRDSAWMGKVHRALGLTVGCIVSDLGHDSDARRAAYAADITYGTNNEMGFDYLRDNMARSRGDMVQRGQSFAIVDEVDSILIDEARTPLIISGRADEATELYAQVDDFVKRLKVAVFATVDDKKEDDENLDADYIVDEKGRSATLTARGIAKAESYFHLDNLADLDNNTLSHHINQSIRAHGIMKRDIDYIVKDDEVIIVDEFTGRLMIGRRYNEGLHQAIEAKEQVKVEGESRTLATITFQNYFRLYDKLSGMTGTALTEAEEFGAIYKLDIIEIPTNKPLARIDNPDIVYRTEVGKYNAIIDQIIKCHDKGQPVLVGTVSIEKSEHLAKLLRERGLKQFNVLNAKNHEKEAEIVAQAGKLGAVTIATNMAGRGTDIVLGGNAEFMAKNDLRKEGMSDELIDAATGHADTDDAEVLAAREKYAERLQAHEISTSAEAEAVKKAGGLFIIGTERHEARRIDNQLRGRSARQGDPGETRFFIAATDDIMRLFGSDRFSGAMDTLKIDDNTPIDQKLLSNAIETAQKKVESRNFQSRKSVLEFDDVMNTQRALIYDQRAKVLAGEDVRDNIRGMITDLVTSAVDLGADEHGNITSQSDLDEILSQFSTMFIARGSIELPANGKLDKKTLTDKILEQAFRVYDAREKQLGNIPDTGKPFMREFERFIMRTVVDEYWMDHIDAMDELRDGVRLRAYGQVNPVDEYKREGFEMFEAMIDGIKSEVVRRLYTTKVTAETELKSKAAPRNVVAGFAGEGGGEKPKSQPVRVAKKPKPNDPCPCGALRENGTGLRKKYKDCHGRLES
ncbi:MAG: preprotein translocase subunit SecA [Oscillospiraceae bacterium]|jgi:preprotein translocase subunit SecA|nr:preprotein translocase subunit SecA [Oscillospiraceae bacterium]